MKAPSVLALPEIPLGKDDVSFQRHNHNIGVSLMKCDGGRGVDGKDFSHEETRHS